MALRRLSFVTLGALLVACSSESNQSGPTTASTTTGTTTTSTTTGPPPEPPQLADVQGLVTSPRNVVITWAPVADASVRIERLDGSAWVEVASKPSEHGRFLDLGLSPETAYQYRAVACAGDLCGAVVALPELTTPATELPALQLTVPPNGTADDVVVFGAFDFTTAAEGHIAAVDRQGRVLWEWLTHETGPVTEIQPLSHGSLLVGLSWRMAELDLDGKELFRQQSGTAHHDMDELADGRILRLSFDSFETQPGYLVAGDTIELVGLDRTTVEWSWRGQDHIPLTDVNDQDILQDAFGFGHDWTHSNSLWFDEQESKIYLNVRNLNRIYRIDYPSGDVDWVMGDGGDFGGGIWDHAHDPQYLSAGHLLIFDNGLRRPGPDKYTRVIEVAYDPGQGSADVVWEYRETPDFYSAAQGACHVEDNGNIFVTDSMNGRIFEVTREKQVVWELRHDKWSYKAVTVPRTFFSDW